METTVEVSEQSQTAEVRRVVAEMAKTHAMTEADAGRASLIATEAATNILKHGKQGVIAVSWFEEGGAAGIQLVAADKGPGFANFLAAARDGYSTAGSLGIGIGAMMRKADVFDMFSIESMGAALLARICMGKVRLKAVPGKLWIGSRSMPKLGETACGDAWSSKQAGRWQRICVVDGLGHGPLAASASAEAVKVFWNCPETDSPENILQKAHVALKSTRGAVMAVVSIDVAAGVAQFAGVGNIAGVILDENSSQHLISVEGIVGYNLRVPRLRQYVWGPGSMLVMNSDGLSTRWNFSKSPGLLHKHPALIAAVLHRDFARDSDDSTVVVAKVQQ